MQPTSAVRLWPTHNFRNSKENSGLLHGAKKYIKSPLKVHMRGWRDDSVSNLLALQARGPEFDPPPKLIYKSCESWHELVIRAVTVEIGGYLGLDGQPS